MKVAVIGATGRTGRELVRVLTSRGHDVRVLIRDPRLDPVLGITDTVTGDSRDAETLDLLLDGVDALVSALGPTLVQPPRLVDGPASGTLEHDVQRSTRSTRITRPDLAAFLVDCVERDLYPPTGAVRHDRPLTATGDVDA